MKCDVFVGTIYGFDITMLKLYYGLIRSRTLQIRKCHMGHTLNLLQ